MKTNENKTQWLNPDGKMNTQWGYITHEEWCEKESQRMNINGGDTVVVRENGMVAIANF